MNRTIIQEEFRRFKRRKSLWEYLFGEKCHWCEKGYRVERTDMRDFGMGYIVGHTTMSGNAVSGYEGPPMAHAKACWRDGVFTRQIVGRLCRK